MFDDKKKKSNQPKDWCDSMKLAFAKTKVGIELIFVIQLEIGSLTLHRTHSNDW